MVESRHSQVTPMACSLSWSHSSSSLRPFNVSWTPRKWTQTSSWLSVRLAWWSISSACSPLVTTTTDTHMGTHMDIHMATRLNPPTITLMPILTSPNTTMIMIIVHLPKNMITQHVIITTILMSILIAHPQAMITIIIMLIHITIIYSLRHLSLPTDMITLTTLIHPLYRPTITITMTTVCFPYIVSFVDCHLPTCLVADLFWVPFPGRPLARPLARPLSQHERCFPTRDGRHSGIGGRDNIDPTHQPVWLDGLRSPCLHLHRCTHLRQCHATRTRQCSGSHPRPWPGAWDRGTTGVDKGEIHHHLHESHNIPDIDFILSSWVPSTASRRMRRRGFGPRTQVLLSARSISNSVPQHPRWQVRVWRIHDTTG